MAILSSPINFQRITKTAQGIKNSVSSAGKTVKKIGDIVFYRTKMKREAFANSKMLRGRRVEYERRKELEDEIESPRVAIKPDGPQKLVQMDTSKGFFDRILGFVGYLTAGWIMNNLPTLIGMGKEFIARIQKANQILVGFFNNTIQLFAGVGNILGALGQNLMSFDLFDTSKRLKNSFDGLNFTIENMGKQIEEAFGLVTTPLTEGKYSGEQIPGFGTEYQSEGAYETQTPSGGTAGGGRWKPLLDLIASGEGNYTSIAPSDQNPNLTSMTIAEANKAVGLKGGKGAIGRYQFTSPIAQARAAGLNPDKDIFSPENQDRMAIAIIENKRRGRDWLAGKITNEQFSEYLAREWGALRSASGYVLPGNSGKIGYEKIKPALQKVKGGSEIPSGQPQQIEQVPPGAVKPTITSRFGAQRGRRNHGGTDLSVPYGTPLRAVADGRIIETGFEKGWGYFLVYQDNAGLYHLYGHMPRGSYKTSGSVRKGEVIGKVGSTGRSTGPHLHWEVGKSWNGIIGSKFDPLKIYSPNAPFNTPPGPGVAPGVPAQISAPSQQRASYPVGITPERRGQDILIVQPPSQQNVILNGGGGRDMEVSQASNFAMLNNFIKNKLLLDLAYL